MFLRSMSELRSLGLVAAMGLIPLGGCAIVDQYGSRAIEYNDQAAASKSSTILLNIMRAAYREPLQFTDLSTVTGLASAQGSLNASIPARIGGHFTTADTQWNRITPKPSTIGTFTMRVCVPSIKAKVGAALPSAKA